MPLRIVFFGTPAFAVPSLDRLLESPHTVTAVVTQPDRPRGRGQKVHPAAVKLRALERGLPVLQPERLRDQAFLERLRRFAPDLGVVAAYGRILPQVALDLPRLGMVNVHASLLPRWRGAAPVHRAILAGDTRTGVTIMRVVRELDAGPMLAKTPVEILHDETSTALEARLAVVGADLLLETVTRIAEGQAIDTPQDTALVTYAARLERAESEIDWNQPARHIHDRIRGLQPWPLAAARLHGQRVAFLRSEVASADGSPAEPGTVLSADRTGLVVATCPGALRLLELQPEGRAPMSATSFLNGRHVSPGDRFAPLATAP
jgi:methionyl-tRNA formyltransferase